MQNLGQFHFRTQAESYMVISLSQMLAKFYNFGQKYANPSNVLRCFCIYLAMLSLVTFSTLQ